MFLIGILAILFKIFAKYEANDFKIISFFLLSLGVFCQQGTSYNITLTSIRCLFIFILFAGILIYNFYTSVLVSHLVNIKYKSSINSIDDLTDSQLDIGFQNISLNKNFFRVSKPNQTLWNCIHWWLQETADPRVVRLLKKKVFDTNRDYESFFEEPNEGFEKVRQGRFGFLCEESHANRVIQQQFEPYEICETHRISFRNELIGMILKKHSPIRERFVINFIWMNEVGIYYKINLHWNGIKITCLSHNHYESVRIEYVAPIFGILILAYLLSVGILFTEIYVKRFKTH